MPQLNYNNKLSRMSVIFRMQALQQLHKEGVKQPSVAQITARALKLYAPTKAQDSSADSDDNYNACPDGMPNGFRSW